MRAPSPAALAARAAAVRAVSWASDATVRDSRTFPSVPCTTTSPPPSLATISTARFTASAWVGVLALGRWASGFSTAQPSSVGLT